MPDPGRRNPFPTLADPVDEDLTPVPRAEMAELRKDVRAVLDAQTADRKQLNGRMGALDGRIGGVEKEQRTLAASVVGFDRKLDRLLGEKTAEAKTKAADAKVTAAKLGLSKAKWVTVGKVVAAIVTAVLGLLVGHFLNGCV